MNSDHMRSQGSNSAANYNEEIIEEYDRSFYINNQAIVDSQSFWKINEEYLG